jgi:hypothetical protein
MSAPLVLALILAVAIPWQLFRAYRFDDSSVDRWARDHDLELTPESRPVVRRHLRRAGLCRTWGGVAGAVLPTLIDYVANGRVQVLGFGTDGESAPLGFGTIFVGYLLGALAAEVSTVRPVAAERRAASLIRRDLEDYLPRRLVLAQRALAVAAALGMVVAALLPYPDSLSVPSDAGVAAIAAGILAFAAGLEAVERWLVRRPQPFTSAALVTADDAIRAQSIRAMAGAGMALLLLLCSGVSLALAASDVAALHITMLVPAVGCLLGSIVAVGDVSESRWRVRRSVRAVSA